ncbi:gp53-like domain-containing protein, partial [Escherichia albertii]|uniref:gp53-like domain-containing protein n=1 Tax=Escherichia albertii TaxID=208962 RepID=UPI003FCD6866
TSADKLPYFTGADRAALTALTSVGRAILGKPSTQGVLDYLGLGEAAKRDVGNGQNQIPDMSAWECGGDTTTGWRRSPDGYIEQWGLTGATTNEVLINFPIPFPTAVISINEHDQAPVAGKMSVWQFYKLTNSNVIAE